MQKNERMSKAAKQKCHVNYRGSYSRITPDYLTEIFWLQVMERLGNE